MLELARREFQERCSTYFLESTPLFYTCITNEFEWGKFSVGDTRHRN